MGIKKLEYGGIDNDYYSTHFNELRDDIFDELNIKDHPKAGKLYAIAYDLSHTYGASEIWYYALDLVELINEKANTNMGYYTELIFGCSLGEDTPHEIIRLLKFMVDSSEFKTWDEIIDNNSKEPWLPDHPLFSDTRWRWIFQCASYYFGVNEPMAKIWYDDIRHCWQISTRSNLKNYDEIELFLDWIKPYIDSGSGLREMYAIVTTEDGEPKIYYLDNSDDE